MKQPFFKTLTGVAVIGAAIGAAVGLGLYFLFERLFAEATAADSLSGRQAAQMFMGFFAVFGGILAALIKFFFVDHRPR
ncbi:MAG: hypothetical protein ACK4P3_05415 [Fimbriimonadaceae bacterium]